MSFLKKWKNYGHFRGTRVSAAAQDSSASKHDQTTSKIFILYIVGMDVYILLDFTEWHLDVCRKCYGQLSDQRSEMDNNRVALF